MNRTEKTQFVDELKSKFTKANGAFLAEYRGLTVDQMYGLRKGIIEGKGELKVIKNRLAKIAVKGTDFEPLTDHLTGPLAVAFSFDDQVAIAKALTTAAKDAAVPLEIKTGIVDGQVLDLAKIKELSSLPDRHTLLSMLLSGVSGPLQNFVNVMTATPRNLVNTLTSLKTKKEKEA